MESVDQILVIAGVGIPNDRYGMNKGAFSVSKPKIRHLSLISLEAIERANEGRDIPFTEAETRRNVVTTGIDLNELVDVHFMIGNVALRGTQLCNPCQRIGILAHKKGMMQAFQNGGGIRAEVLTSGLITIGDTIT
jgi:MOSC domain-containing protein YiiM